MIRLHRTRTDGPPRRHPRLRRTGIGLLVVLLVLSPWEWSLFRAMTVRSTDSEAARFAEWVRGQGGGGLVTWAENLQYKLHPPKVGGAPNSSSPLLAGAGASATPADVGPSAVPSAATSATPSATAQPSGTATPTSAANSPVTHHAPAPFTTVPLADVAPLVQPSLPGEGKWRTLVTVHGVAAMRVAYLRPDDIHTSYTSAIVRMDQRLLRTVYHTGTDQPGGGPWSLPPNLAGPRRVGLLAAYNSAFRLGDAEGGFYNEGRTVAALRPGAASMVTYTDGRVDVGAWGQGLGMSAGIASVRQNLRLVVSGGAVVPDINDNTGQRWGKTLSYKAYVWRTGVGIAANGDVVFACGNSLSAATLARLLVKGGAVRAMELDINPAWTSFNLYNQAAGTPSGERKLLPDMDPAVSRYDWSSSRDFYAVYVRS